MRLERVRIRKAARSSLAAFFRQQDSFIEGIWYADIQGA